MTDTEKAALEKRIDELCAEVERLKREKPRTMLSVTARHVAELQAEVERLHAEQAHWELGNCPSCPNVVSLQEALEQNARLRELLQRLHKEYQYIRVRPRQMYLQHEQRMRSIEDEMRELGIEVDNGTE